MFQPMLQAGTVDWRLEFPDGTVGLAQSRVTETTRGTCIYSFVLHAPPVALEQIEGALEAQSSNAAIRARDAEGADGA